MESERLLRGELESAMRVTMVGMLTCRRRDERRAAALDLKTAVTALKKGGSTKEAWRQARILNRLLLDDDTVNNVDEVAISSRLGKSVLCMVNDVAISIDSCNYSELILSNKVLWSSFINDIQYW